MFFYCYKTSSRSKVRAWTERLCRDTDWGWGDPFYEVKRVRERDLSFTILMHQINTNKK